VIIFNRLSIFKNFIVFSSGKDTTYFSIKTKKISNFDKFLLNFGEVVDFQKRREKDF